MAGNGSRSRRRRKRSEANRSTSHTTHGITPQYPNNDKVFYIYGETFSKVGTRTSELLGPFSHIRISSEYCFAGDDVEKEEEIAFFDGLWWQILSEESEQGYYEIVFTTHNPDQ